MMWLSDGGADLVNFVADKPFANTISGYFTAAWLFLISVLAPIVVGRVVARIDAKDARITERLDKQDVALASHSQALALLVQSRDNSETTLLKVPTLESSLAVLRDRMDRHDEWAQRSRAEMLEQQQAAARPRPS